MTMLRSLTIHTTALPTLLHLAVLALVSLAGHSFADTTSLPKWLDKYESARSVYQKGVLAVANNDIAQAHQAVEQLNDYPLKPFLEEKILRKQLINTSDSLEALAQSNVWQQYKSFQRQYNGQRLEKILSTELLKKAGTEENWPMVEALAAQSYRYASTECIKLEAKRALHPDTFDTSAAFEQIQIYWLSGKSLAKACDNLLQHFSETNHISTALYWQRFEKAYSINQMRLAKSLITSLSSDKQALAKKLINPVANKEYWFFQLAHAEQSNLPPLSSATQKRLLRKLAASDLLGVAGLISNHKLTMREKDWLEIKALTAWYFAKNDAPTALGWINSQDEKNTSAMVQKSLRYSLQAKDWPSFIQAFNSAPKALKHEDEWEYWYAIALLETSKQKSAIEQAENILKSLATKPNFYGLLSAKYFKQSLMLDDSADLADVKIPEAMQKRFATAIELYLNNENALANKYWYFASKGMNRTQWMQAASIAHTLQWHERVIRSIASVNLKGVADEKYPLAFDDIYRKASSNTGVDIGWLMALSRQESWFSPLAQSGKGARGVMQLMPATAKRVSQSLKLPYSKEKLFEPEYNITLGSTYLEKLLARFNHNYVLATAAYNAGPSRVDEWLSLRPLTDDWAHWIATIPYKETRKYVKNILAYSHFYQHRLPTQWQGDLKLTLFQFDAETGVLNDVQ